VLLFTRIVQEIDFGNELGIFPPAVTYLMTKLVSGTLFCILFTLVWGWHKILLPSKDKAQNIIKADKMHTAARLIIVASELVFGVLSIVTLPEKYKNAGVYNGTPHGIGRFILFVLCLGLVYLIRKLGLNIRDQLAAGAQKKVSRGHIRVFLRHPLLTMTPPPPRLRLSPRPLQMARRRRTTRRKGTTRRSLAW